MLSEMYDMSIKDRRTPIASRHHCRSLVLKLAAKSPMDPDHVLYRRECFRWALQAPAAIRYDVADGTQVVLEATVEDLSASGIGLLCQSALSDNLPAEVFIESDGRMYSAAVRITHTSTVSNGFHIGCQFVVREEGE
jgi:hypothetical protein